MTRNRSSMKAPSVRPSPTLITIERLALRSASPRATLTLAQPVFHISGPPFIPALHLQTFRPVTLYAAYTTFRGKTVSSTDLREYAPQVFDSKRSGHSCNCTLLFMVLKMIGAITTIEGKGVRGNPFRVTIPLSANEHP